MKDLNLFLENKINFFEKVYHSSEKSDGYLKDFFAEYINTEKKEFEHNAIVFGEEKTINVHILSVLHSITYREKIPFAILEFTKTSNQLNFNKLINSYYYDSLLHILALKEKTFVSGLLVSDIALSFIFCSIFFPDDLDLISKQLVNVLNDYLKREKENPKLQRGEFGRSSTIYLAAYLASYFKLKEISDILLDFCKKNIQSDYFKAINDINFLKDNFEYTCIEGMLNFHINNSKSDLTLPFNHELWQYFPIEVLSLLILRERNGLKNEKIESSNFIRLFIPYIYEKNIVLDAETQKVKSRILCSGNG